MKAGEVLKLLGICRTTLYLHTKNGTLKATKLENGYYDYDAESVFSKMKKDKRKNVLYARVSTYKQKKDLLKQVTTLQNYAIYNDIQNYQVVSEISSGLNLDRKHFDNLLDDVINYRVKNIYITHKDRLTRLSFRTLKQLFSKFGTFIVPINNEASKNNDNEVFEELISLMHIFSTSLYSNRRKNKIKIYKKDIQNFIEPDK